MFWFRPLKSPGPASTVAAAHVRPYVIEEYTTTVCPVCCAQAPPRSTDPQVWKDGLLVRHSGSIWLRRFCSVHGETESLYEEDADLWSQRRGWSAPTQPVCSDRAGHAGGGPAAYGAGLPESHGQHTCTLLLNLTGQCGFSCPACYAAAGPAGLPGAAQCEPAIADVLHTVETVIQREGGRLGVLMLSGGEPAQRPDLPQLLQALLPLPITRIMLNTNGRRIATDDALVQVLSQARQKLEVYLQFDGLRPATYIALRGADVSQEKLAALERLNAAQVFTTLVPTIARGINEDELGGILRLGLATPYCAGLALQPLFGSGRALAFDPRDRATPTGVIRCLAAQSQGLLQAADFIPLPCPQRDCCDITYLIQGAHGRWRPLPRIIGRERLKHWVGLIANTMTFEHLSGPVRSMLGSGALKRILSEQLGSGQAALAQDVARLCACTPQLGQALAGLRRRPRRGATQCTAAEGAASCNCSAGAYDALTQRTFRITVKMFMDAHTLNMNRLRQCCVHTGTYEDDPRRYPFCWRWLFADASDFPQDAAGHSGVDPV